VCALLVSVRCHTLAHALVAVQKSATIRVADENERRERTSSDRGRAVGRGAAAGRSMLANVGRGVVLLDAGGASSDRRAAIAGGLSSTSRLASVLLGLPVVGAGACK